MHTETQCLGQRSPFAENCPNNPLHKRPSSLVVDFCLLRPCLAGLPDFCCQTAHLALEIGGMLGWTNIVHIFCWICLRSLGEPRDHQDQLYVRCWVCLVTWSTMEINTNTTCTIATILTAHQTNMGCPQFGEPPMDAVQRVLTSSAITP